MKIMCFRTIIQTYCEDWPRGYGLFVFDLTPDFNHSDHYSLLRTGNIRLEADFENSNDNSDDNSEKEAITILIFAEFDNMIEITHGRNILYDYAS